MWRRGASQTERGSYQGLGVGGSEDLLPFGLRVSVQGDEEALNVVNATELDTQKYLQW